MTQPVYKFCGVHSEAGLRTAADSKAAYIGFVMAESRRYVSPGLVKEWLETYPELDKKIVFLFVNETMDTIKKAVQTVRPDVIQLHGSESPQQTAVVKNAFPDIEIWKAIHHEPNSLLTLETYFENVDGFVIDAKTKHAWGGSGESFDWSHAGRYIEYGNRQNIPLFIAGGITPENVQELLDHKPWGIDLSSGLESNGEKVPEKVRQLEKRLCGNE